SRAHAQENESLRARGGGQPIPRSGLLGLGESEPEPRRERRARIDAGQSAVGLEPRRHGRGMEKAGMDPRAPGERTRRRGLPRDVRKGREETGGPTVSMEIVDL